MIEVTRYEHLLSVAQNNDIPVDMLPRQRGTISLCLADGCRYVGLPGQFAVLPEPCKVTRLGHELGHCMTYSFYNRYSSLDDRGKHERRADEWLVRELVKPEDISNAIREGCRELWQFAEYFNLPIDFCQKVFDVYGLPKPCEDTED